MNKNINKSILEAVISDPVIATRIEEILGKGELTNAIKDLATSGNVVDTNDPGHHILALDAAGDIHPVVLAIPDNPMLIAMLAEMGIEHSGGLFDEDRTGPIFYTTERQIDPDKDRKELLKFTSAPLIGMMKSATNGVLINGEPARVVTIPITSKTLDDLTKSFNDLIDLINKYVDQSVELQQGVLGKIGLVSSDTEEVKAKILEEVTRIIMSKPILGSHVTETGEVIKNEDVTPDNYEITHEEDLDFDEDCDCDCDEDCDEDDSDYLEAMSGIEGYTQEQYDEDLAADEEARANEEAEDQDESWYEL